MAVKRIIRNSKLPVYDLGVGMEYCRVGLESCSVGWEYIKVVLEYCRVGLEDCRRTKFFEGRRFKKPQVLMELEERTKC